MSEQPDTGTEQIAGQESIPYPIPDSPQSPQEGTEPAAEPAPEPPAPDTASPAPAPPGDGVQAAPAYPPPLPGPVPVGAPHFAPSCWRCMIEAKARELESWAYHAVRAGAMHPIVVGGLQNGIGQIMRAVQDAEHFGQMLNPTGTRTPGGPYGR